MNKQIYKTIIWITIFAIAMAYLESAVVVYLRAIYYPEGFDFPLKFVENNIAFTELFREIATIIMLAGAGIIAGRRNIEKFAIFIYVFAVWDIFYYVFLKIILNWPESFLTFDVLFLIPVTWVGPVIAPIINSLTMILLSALIIYFIEKKGHAKTGFIVWALLITGSLIVIFSYTKDYLRFMLQTFSLKELLIISNSKNIITYASNYIPLKFNWLIFITGEMILILGIIRLYYINRK